MLQHDKHMIAPPPPLGRTAASLLGTTSSARSKSRSSRRPSAPIPSSTTSARPGRRLRSPIAQSPTPAINVGTATPVIDLGTAADFCLLTKAGITSTGATSVGGNIGTSPIAATAITGFALQYDSDDTSATSSLVSGSVYAADFATTTPAKMTEAISDMEAAYVDAAGRPNPVTVERGAGLIGNMTLAGGGVHKWSTVVTVPVGQKLYFDARGDNDTVWIMQIAQGLNFMADSEVVLLNGAKPSNIFWQVAGVATILAGAHAEG
eukprot:scaffold13748_cov52-Phaeocystis_antarctica.AAC.2